MGMVFGGGGFMGVVIVIFGYYFLNYGDGGMLFVLDWLGLYCFFVGE